MKPADAGSLGSAPPGTTPALPSFLGHGLWSSLLVHGGVWTGYSLYLWCAVWWSANELPQWFQPPSGVQSIEQSPSAAIEIEAAYARPRSDPRSEVHVEPVDELPPSDLAPAPVAVLVAQDVPRRPVHLAPHEHPLPPSEPLRTPPPARRPPAAAPHLDCSVEPLKRLGRPAERMPVDDRAEAHARATVSLVASQAVDQPTLPQKLYSPAPEYPPGAYRDRIGGQVKLLVTLTAEGTVASLRVVQSSGNGELDAAAARAVAGWRFESVGPAHRTARRGIVPIRFIPPDR